MLTKQNQKGFTLIELIIVVSIIAVLAAIAFMSLSGETAQARDSKRVSDLKTFEDSIATSNGKNKKIDYNNNASLGSVPNSYTATASYSITTNAGVLVPLRGAYLIPMKEGIFDSDVIPTVTRDPKGSPYYGAFLSTTDYQLFATAENPDTKQPTAIVRGSFKEGAIIDILMEDTAINTTTFKVANPRRFVAGDTIKIDSESRIVAGFNTVDSTVTVTVATAAIHNKGAAIKLATSKAGANALACLGSAVATAIANASTSVVIGTAAAYQAAMTSAATGTANNVVGVICAVTSPNATVTAGPLVDTGLAAPYTVTAE